MVASISKNIEILKQRIKNAALKSGRNPSDIKLVVVTKTHPSNLVDIALRSGIKFIGENRIQEAEEKIPLLIEKFEEFHFIGHLQSNKIPRLIKLNPVLIHSIDKFSTAEKLNDLLIQINQKQDVLIQVNTSFEESKFGIEPNLAINFIQDVSELSNLNIKGLMTIGKFTNDENEIRNCFRTLKKLFDEIKLRKIKSVEMKYLSMGMTNDFEIAIEEGANIVRIGSAIFGERKY
ncbi:MAG TPA: YggS family pyridoxal phosphate-dependent enzyme [Candidatus Cloacimonetes bacterium]|nr:YggS family pyridoxal phosphate-dependent enzyme [Candidatus Cloacimonadota bacterium]